MQFAKTAGARVIITSSSDEKIERARAMGAAEGINYALTPEWEKEVLRLTDGRGVDHIVEVGGAGSLARSFQAVAPSGQIALIGVLAGMTGDTGPHPLMMKGASMHGIAVGNRTMFEEMNRALETNQIRPVVDKVFPFEEAAAAFRHQASGEFMGKVVVGSLISVETLPLHSRTPLDWGRAALGDTIALLRDHAFLEKKAAANALELMTRWPGEWTPGWVETMTGVARDEASHLAQTVRLLARRGGQMERGHRCAYAKALRALVRKGGTEETLDRSAGVGADRGALLRTIFRAGGGRGRRRSSRRFTKRCFLPKWATTKFS